MLRGAQRFVCRSRGAPYGHATVAAALNMPDVPVVPQKRTRSLWVNGRLHVEATLYLEYRHPRVQTDWAPRNDMYTLCKRIDWLSQLTRHPHRDRQ